MPINGLTALEQKYWEKLTRKIHRQARKDRELAAYYEAEQRLEHLGIAVPKELRRFEAVVNMCRVAVDEVQRRLAVKAVMWPKEEDTKPELEEIWDANNLQSVLALVWKDALIFGRGYLSVSSGETPGDYPIIMAENPREMAAWWDARTGTLSAAVRKWYDPIDGTNRATLYTRDAIISLTSDGGWKIVERYRNDTGEVPIFCFVNRPKTGPDFTAGVSEMADVIKLTDAIARTITNMQVGLETSALPQKTIAGMSPEEFALDNQGRPSKTLTYFGSLLATSNPDVKFGTLSPGNLTTFHDSVNNMLAWCAAVLGLPTRYAGQQSVNPAAEGAIRADESRLVKNTEDKGVLWGSPLGAALAFAWLLYRQERVPGGRVKIIWHDPSTPTFAQKADALTKLAGGVPVLSREGVWDELGWGAARKRREEKYFAKQNGEALAIEHIENKQIS